MRIHFDKNQAYQLQAIQSVIDLFEGQQMNEPGFDLPLVETDMPFAGFELGNRLTLTPEEISENLVRVQQKNGISDNGSAAELKKLSYYENADSKQSDKGKLLVAPFANFSVEMETGTGKTYVYLRTIYELNKAYRFKKFVIVVPSVAIREGVLKTLQMTFEHFREIYRNQPAEYRVYDSTRIAQLGSFAKSDAIQILVINIDSFTKDANIINQVQETGVKPIEYIRSTNPIVIIDEPQNVETDIRKKAIANLNPLFTLRYSATHRNQYNLIYRLDPVKAYDLGLVKQIEVDSVVARNDNSGVFIGVDGMKTTSHSISARITIWVNGKSGPTKKKVTAMVGDDLFELSNNLEMYKQGFVINELDAGEGRITFSGGKVVHKGEATGGLTDEVLKKMIDATVENHFRKEKELKAKGIKVLSIFFVNRVANYRDYDEDGNPVPGKFARWFEESFNKWRSAADYKNLYEYDASEVHDGYFSQDKGRFKDSREGRSTKADDETYKLIMQDKERLLSPATPLRFIFSHSALREGWDNPNVFQICTLSETKSDIKKRQEIGRGLRLCVDQNGVRNHERAVNRLTVIANESYESFSKALQREIQSDCGVRFEGRIKNARERKRIHPRNDWTNDPLFKELWNKIRYRTSYTVQYSTDELTSNSIAAIKRMEPVSTPVIQREKYATSFIKDEQGNLTHVGGIPMESKNTEIKEVRYQVPDCISFIRSQTGLTRTTIVRILTESNRLQEIFVNPQAFMDQAAALINRELDYLKAKGIRYEPMSGKPYETNIFESTATDHYLENLLEIEHPEKTIYNYIPINPLSATEKQFVAECDQNEEILFYIRLPESYIIDTPAGNHRPGWVVLKKDAQSNERICFVVDIKGATSPTAAIQTKNTRGIIAESPKKHFQVLNGVHYRIAASIEDLKI